MSEELIDRMCDSIVQKNPIEKNDLSTFIKGVAERQIPVPQIEKWLKSVHQHGISVEDTTALTEGMMNSGAVLNWQGTANVVDKHSTGGVGDKMSLMLAPALAACGMRVPMLAGRGLGHTGGTIDKLESIPGFNCDLTPQRMQEVVAEIGCCIAAQNDSIAPADGLLYAIRDVTNTVDSIPLITASIVSKKAAEGLNALVLDVKCGKAAFMKTMHEAKELAESMVRTANGLGIRTVAQVTDMNQPIGSHIGNALEVVESIQVLQGKGTSDTRNLVVMQAGKLMELSSHCATFEEGKTRIEKVLDNGEALEKFIDMCVAQGTPLGVAQQLASDPESVLGKANKTTAIACDSSGFIQYIDAMALAEVARELGAGRFELSDNVQHDVGFVVEHSINQPIKQGQTWIHVHHNLALSNAHLEKIRDAITISTTDGEHFTRLLLTVE